MLALWGMAVPFLVPTFSVTSSFAVVFVKLILVPMALATIGSLKVSVMFPDTTFVRVPFTGLMLTVGFVSSVRLVTEYEETLSHLRPFRSSMPPLAGLV